MERERLEKAVDCLCWCPSSNAAATKQTILAEFDRLTKERDSLKSELEEERQNRIDYEVANNALRIEQDYLKGYLDRISGPWREGVGWERNAVVRGLRKDRHDMLADSAEAIFAYLDSLEKPKEDIEYIHGGISHSDVHEGKAEDCPTCHPKPQCEHKNRGALDCCRQLIWCNDCDRWIPIEDIKPKPLSLCPECKGSAENTKRTGTYAARHCVTYKRFGVHNCLWTRENNCPRCQGEGVLKEGKCQPAIR